MTTLTLPGWQGELEIEERAGLHVARAINPLPEASINALRSKESCQAIQRALADHGINVFQAPIQPDFAVGYSHDSGDLQPITGRTNNSGPSTILASAKTIKRNIDQRLRTSEIRLSDPYEIYSLLQDMSDTEQSDMLEQVSSKEEESISVEWNNNQPQLLLHLPYGEPGTPGIVHRKGASPDETIDDHEKAQRVFHSDVPKCLLHAMVGPTRGNILRRIIY